MENRGEIVLYHPDDEVKIEVRIEEETVWLTQAQMVSLFNSTKQNISLHINNIFKERELLPESTVKDYLTVQTEGNRKVKRKITWYNLDVIISVGYRVKSIRGTQFRQWANKVLKDYLLKGYSVSQRLVHLEEKMDARFQNYDRQIGSLTEKVDFFVRTSLPPVEGIFYDGQIFDAYKFATDLIRSAKRTIVLIDNYIDESVLLMLSKREPGVKAEIYTRTISRSLQLDLDRYNSQYPPIEVHINRRSHDRFLIIDEVDVYHIGASLKDLGKKLFAFSRLNIPASSITALL